MMIYLIAEFFFLHCNLISTNFERDMFLFLAFVMFTLVSAKSEVSNLNIYQTNIAIANDDLAVANIFFTNAFLNIPKFIIYTMQINYQNSWWCESMFEANFAVAIACENLTANFYIQVNVFAMESTVENIQTCTSQSIPISSSYQISPVNNPLISSSFDIAKTVGYVFINGITTNQGSNYYIETSLTFDKTNLNVNINSSQITFVRVSMIFFDLSSFYFLAHYEFHLQGTASPPLIYQSPASIGILGLSNIKSGTGTNRVIFDCSLDVNTNLPTCRTDIQASPSKYLFLILYIRDRACVPGYYDPNTDRTSCECKPGFTRSVVEHPHQLCRPIQTQTSLTISSIDQYLNKIQVIAQYSDTIEFYVPLREAVLVYLNEEEVKPQTTKLNGSKLRIQFNLLRAVQKIRIFVKKGTVKNIQAPIQTILGQHQAQVSQNLYKYSEIEQKMIQLTQQFLQNSTNTLNSFRGLGIIFGGVGYLLDAIEFTQEVSLYLFLDFKLPNNLRTILEVLYYSSSASIIPIKIDSPFLSHDGQFVRSQRYETYDYNFNFTSQNIYSIAQIIGMILFFHISQKIAACSKSDGWVLGYISRLFRRKYLSKSYSNSIQCFLSCQLLLTFGAAVVVLDRGLWNRYKCFNFAMALLFLFVAGILSIVIHPIYLINIKKSKKIDTGDCYPRLFRHTNDLKNQKNICLRYINCFCIAISIPLAPSYVSVSLMILLFIFELRAIRGATFQSKFYKFNRYLSLLLQVILHFCLLVCWFLQQYNFSLVTPIWQIILGYIAAAIILLHLVVDFIIIIIEMVTWAFRKVWRFCTKNDQEKKQNDQKEAEIVSYTFQENTIRRKNKVVPRVVMAKNNETNIDNSVQSPIISKLNKKVNDQNVSRNKRKKIITIRRRRAYQQESPLSLNMELSKY